MNFFLGQVNLVEKFESLKETMEIYQQNINNNISWFYATLAIIAGVLIVGLYFLVKTSVSMGIEKGILNANNNLMATIQNEKQLYTAKGTAGALGLGEFRINGLVNFTPDKFVSLIVYKKVSGNVVPFTIMNFSNGGLTVKVNGQDLKDYDSNGTMVSDGFIQWTLVWLKDEIN